ncbi:MAG: ketoacyl-ACP synthase III [Bdellovibrionaceae bacterium]|nr:ketoacyl-ACP synthase III [Pseudobdellovibrionaceae bacterium]MDW8190734.1 beta-ketoacyl-ACP synthase III [Pseudobdellovibrionaceae bacterium]
MFRSRVAGTGHYLPLKILTNFDLERLVDTTDQWIRERTGIERRHVAADDEVTTDLALKATLKALEDAGKTPNDLDMIIFCTVTGDQVMPSSACVLQQKLGCDRIPAFDLSAACSGFVYGLSVADQFIKTGHHRCILIVGAEIIHRFVNYKDRETCILFGDGAGAFILERADHDDSNVILSTHLRAEGALGDLFVLPAGGSKKPFSQEVLDKGEHYVRMKGREIFKNAVRTMAAVCQEALEHNKIGIDQVSWLVPHQANWRIMEAVAEHFGFPKEKVVSVVHEMGNTSAATIPVAFDMARKDGRIKRGQFILLTAFGAGLTAGSALLRF